MNNQPFFSLVIPTYNRPQQLKVALKSILRQNFRNFEVVISDNSPDNQSTKICKSFNDRRIRYIRNKENIGFARNLYQVIKLARGKYVVILGDDDFILSPKTFANLYEYLKKRKYGFVRMKMLYHRDFKVIFDMNKLSSLPKKILEKNSSGWETIKFIQSANSALISGLIFKNFNLRIPELEKSTDPDFTLELFWIEFIYEQAKRFGGYIDVDNVIMVRWLVQTGGNSASANKEKVPSLVAVVNNELYMEKSWKMIFKRLNQSERKLWIKEQTQLMIPLLPSVKFYSFNSNLLRYVKRMLELNNGLLYQPGFYFYLVVGLLMPRWVWDKLRTVVQNRNQVSDPTLSRPLKEFKRNLFPIQAVVQ